MTVLLILFAALLASWLNLEDCDDEDEAGSVAALQKGFISNLLARDMCSLNEELERAGNGGGGGGGGRSGDRKRGRDGRGRGGSGRGDGGRPRSRDSRRGGRR